MFLQTTETCGCIEELDTAVGGPPFVPMKGAHWRMKPKVIGFCQRMLFCVTATQSITNPFLFPHHQIPTFCLGPLASYSNTQDTRHLYVTLQTSTCLMADNVPETAAVSEEDRFKQQNHMIKVKLASKLDALPGFSYVTSGKCCSVLFLCYVFMFTGKISIKVSETIFSAGLPIFFIRYFLQLLQGVPGNRLIFQRVMINSDLIMVRGDSGTKMDFRGNLLMFVSCSGVTAHRRASQAPFLTQFCHLRT